MTTAGWLSLLCAVHCLLEAQRCGLRNRCVPPYSVLRDCDADPPPHLLAGFRHGLFGRSRRRAARPCVCCLQSRGADDLARPTEPVLQHGCRDLLRCVPLLSLSLSLSLSPALSPSTFPPSLPLPPLSLSHPALTGPHASYRSLQRRADLGTGYHPRQHPRHAPQHGVRPALQVGNALHAVLSDARDRLRRHLARRPRFPGPSPSLTLSCSLALVVARPGPRLTPLDVLCRARTA